MNGVVDMENTVDEHRSWFLPGEKIQYIDKNIRLICLGGQVPGWLLISNYRIAFETVAIDALSHPSYPSVQSSLGLVLKVEKIGNQSGIGSKGEVYGVMITTKDNYSIRLACPDREGGRKGVVEALQTNAFPLIHHKPFFATLFHSSRGNSLYCMDGWTVYDAEKEWDRMGIDSATWTLTDVNHNYQLSSTYPRVLVVPTAAMNRGRDFLARVAHFRSKERLAVLSWLHPQSHASITRCSQPLTGLTNKKSNDDETYMKMLLSANANGHQLYIFDARPSVNATVNRAKGGGFEMEYDRCVLKFLNIQNIHVVRDSLRKLMECLYPKVDDKQYWRQVEDCRWLHHISSILEGVAGIVEAVEGEQCSAVVHCSDGWDRTSQLTALSMLLLDPYYRTIEGFAVLIEKEWCSFGHKFSHRCGHGIDSSSDNERSPIFIQFLDCVWQIMSQFEVFFEFTQYLVMEIADELYSCRYGTFLYNSEKERKVEKNCPSTTISLWSRILSKRNSYINPLYISSPGVLYINASLRCLKVWTAYYGRHNDMLVSPHSQFIKKTALTRACGTRTLLDQLVLAHENYHISHV